MALNEEQIFALAPDEASKKSGKELASPAKWVSRGADESALWGECQGSGSKPYQTQVDITNLAFKCSCPSRKFPCKHGIGLLLYYARQPKDFVVTQAPLWVKDWITKRIGKQENQADKKDKPADEVAQAKRQASREQKVAEGLDELLLWVKDVVRDGILNIPEKGSAYFEAIARRMVDAQAPGIAGMVRSLANISYFKEGWQSTFIDQLARIYLVIKGYKNRSVINEPLHKDIRAWIGFTQNQEELKEQQGVMDTWLVLGKQTAEEDNLTVERNWLFGIQSKKYALVLQFIFRGQGGQLTLTPGLYLQAELVFYPSAFTLRALIKKQVSTIATPTINGFSNWQQLTGNETAVASLQPFYSDRAYIINQLTPVQYDNHWWLKDNKQCIMPIKDNYAGIWKLLSLSGGSALTMAIIGKENIYEPIGVWYNNNYHTV